MYLIVGLGNPGKEYAKTRHNVGFIAIDYLAEYYDIKMSKLKFKGVYGEGFIGDEKCILLKPQTYMNLSGESVRDAVEYFNIDYNKILVIYDDFEIDLGKIRIREKGSDGGHNGMKSIIYLLGSNEFPRIRFGVGKPEHNAVNHVLGHFNDEDGVVMTTAIKKIVDIIPTIIKFGVKDAMNKFNGNASN